MDKIKVENSNSLYRDSETGAILNCSDSDYENYLTLKRKRLQEIAEVDNLRNEVSELKSMMKLILDKLDK
jgi:hypothetical protein